MSGPESKRAVLALLRSSSSAVERIAKLDGVLETAVDPIAVLESLVRLADPNTGLIARERLIARGARAPGPVQVTTKLGLSVLSPIELSLSFLVGWNEPAKSVDVSGSLELGLELRHDDEESYEVLGVSFEYAGEVWAACVTLGESATAHFDREADASDELARVLDERRRRLAFLERFASCDLDDVAVAESRELRSPAVLIDLATRLAARGDHDAAISLADTVIARIRELGPTRVKLPVLDDACALVQVRRVAWYVDAGRSEEALAALARDAIRAPLLEAKAHAAGGAFAKAIEAARGAAQTPEVKALIAEWGRQGAPRAVAVGSRVIHARFGAGSVIALDGAPASRKARVRFDAKDAGERVLLASTLRDEPKS